MDQQQVKQRIKQVQAALKQEGHYAGSVDGIPGQRTIAALRDYLGDIVLGIDEQLAKQILQSCAATPSHQVMSAEGMAELIESEGVRSRMYHDSAGLPTIGVGHLLTRSELTSGKIVIKGQPVKWQGGLSEQQIYDLLDQDNDIAEAQVRKYATAPLTQGQFDALVSFAFNVGGGALKRSTLLRKVNAGQHEAVKAQFMRWVYAGGRRIAGLAKRREREAAMYAGEHLA